MDSFCSTDEDTDLQQPVTFAFASCFDPKDQYTTWGKNNNNNNNTNNNAYLLHNRPYEQPE